MLRFTDPEGLTFELDVVGYQYPADVESPLPEFDLNWLMIHISARDHEGREWEAVDPCLLTWELEELARWLEVHSYDDKAFLLLDFTEPCLSFDIQHPDRLGQTVVLNVHLSCELGAPEAGKNSRSDVVLRFVLKEDDLMSAARQCQDLCGRYPHRAALPGREGEQ